MNALGSMNISIEPEGNYIIKPDGTKEKLDYSLSGTISDTYPVNLAKNKFEKVSWEQFKKDTEKILLPYVEERCSRPFSDFVGDQLLKEVYDNITLPRRSTRHSAGYDFYCPFSNIPLYAGESVIIPTGIKMELIPSAFLAIYPRSSYGFKYKMRLDNTVGIIDADYYNNKDNEGHIMIKITCEKEEPEFNLGRPFVTLEQNTKFAQGVITYYGITCDDNPYDTKRTGGIGSTGK